MARMGRPFLDPKLGKMTKHVSLWMHDLLYRQQVVEARFAKMDVKALMRKKLAKKLRSSK